MLDARLLEILACAGVLQPRALPSFRTGFVNHDDRPEPPRPSDFHYPLSCWTAGDGVCAEAVAFWFPGLET